MAQQVLKQCSLKYRYRHVEVLRFSLKQSLEQWNNMFAPLTQGRQVQVQHIEAVIQVTSELPLFDPLRQAGLSRSNHAHVDRYERSRAQAFNTSGFQCA